MRISIRNNGSYIIEFDQIVLSGRQAAGGYAINISMRGDRQASETTITVFDISLTLSLSDPVRPLAVSIPSSSQLIQCNQYSNNNEQIYFETILTKEQVNAIEEYRKEQDLSLNVSLKALVSSGLGLFTSFESTNVQIPREHWLIALKSCGFRQTLLFEVPLPAAPEQLLTLFAKAQEFIEVGHYKDSVMQCRHIIEQVELLRGDKKQSETANAKAHSRDRKDMTAIERMLSLREQVKNVCHLGAHGSDDFTRSQAKAVLGLTMALLAEPTVGFASGYGSQEQGNEE